MDRGQRLQKLSDNKTQMKRFQTVESEKKEAILLRIKHTVMVMILCQSQLFARQCSDENYFVVL